MRLLLSPTLLPGAEMIEHKGEYGVFIPLDCNGTMSKATKKRGPQMLINLRGHRNTVKSKRFNASFKIVPPPEARDKLLERRGRKTAATQVAWLYGIKQLETSETPVSSKDFAELLGL